MQVMRRGRERWGDDEDEHDDVDNLNLEVNLRSSKLKFLTILNDRGLATKSRDIEDYHSFDRLVEQYL